jgi:hypothetical protein
MKNRAEAGEIERIRVVSVYYATALTMVFKIIYTNPPVVVSIW